MKEVYNFFKEAWKDEKKKNAIKIVLWIIFIIIVMIYLNLASKTNNIQKPPTNEEVIKVTYNEMKNALLKNQKVKYQINNYYLEGVINDNIFVGTLEDENIYRLEYSDNKLYRLNKSEKLEEIELLKEINLNYLIPENIINMLNENDSLKREEESIKTFNYNVDNTLIKVTIDDTSITKIEINENDINYILEYKEL